MVEQVLSDIEKIIHDDPGKRGLSELFIPGTLQNAALRVLKAKRVAVCTGFFIPSCDAPETDGPPGALTMVRALHAVNIDACIITDELSRKVMEECICVYEANSGRSVPLIIYPISKDKESEKLFMETHISGMDRPHIDHLISIERVGRGVDGVYRNMRGNDISAYNAAIDTLFIDAARPNSEISTTGIGDGGNEIGMGKLIELVRKNIKMGDKIATVVETDDLLVSGVSNWAGFALAAAIYICKSDTDGAKSEISMSSALTTVEEQHEIMQAMLRRGAVDGVLGKSIMSVDGLPMSLHDEKLIQVTNLAEKFKTKIMTEAKALDAAQVRELDRKAIEEYRIPSHILMENAGRGCVEELLNSSGIEAKKVVVLCGPGNNGGDGFVVARTLVNRGYNALAYFVGPIKKIEQLSEDTRMNARLWRDLGQEIKEISKKEQLEGFYEILEGTSHVVDALFGTGLERDIRAPYSDVINAVNASKAFVLAVDIPSGLHATSGRILGCSVKADTTVTFVAAKTGMFVGEGPKTAGKVVVQEIGIPITYIREAYANKKN